MGDYHINIFYSEEDSGYIADIPDLESCSAFANTPEKALAEVEQAKQGSPGREAHSATALSSNNLSNSPMNRFSPLTRFEKKISLNV